MPVLGKRTEGRADSLTISEQRELLNALKIHKKELRYMLPDEVFSRIESVLDNWDPKGNIYKFYITARSKLLNLTFEEDYLLPTFKVYFHDNNQLLDYVRDCWNFVAENMASHFSWQVNSKIKQAWV